MWTNIIVLIALDKWQRLDHFHTQGVCRISVKAFKGYTEIFLNITPLYIQQFLDVTGIQILLFIVCLFVLWFIIFE